MNLKGFPMSKRLPKAIYGSPDRPLILADMEIECYVLEDERRVISFAGLQSAMGMAPGGSMVAGKNRLELFASRDRIRQFLTEETLQKLSAPVHIRAGKVKKYALEAEVLPALCEAVVQAFRAQLLQPQQEEIAYRCIAMSEAFQRIAIIALVDEATGFQKVRDDQALQKILAAYVLPEHRPYLKVVPNEFAKEIARLYGWKIPDNNRGPRLIGKMTRALIYKQLPKPVLPGLDEKNPAGKNWQRPRKHHQFLTEAIGLDHFRSQISGVMALLRASKNIDEFKLLFERAYGGQLALDL